ncbi:hypothetical protein [Paludisphaera soli]|nr:hypothetical protein [Paludisphaera soli]
MNRLRLLMFANVFLIAVPCTATASGPDEAAPPRPACRARIC